MSTPAPPADPSASPEASGAVATGPGADPVSAPSLDGSPGSPAERTLFGLPQPEVPDLLLGVASVLLLVAYGPGLDQSSTILLSAAVLPLGAVGLVLAAVLARRGDRAAQVALAYLAWAGLSTLLAPHPRLAFHLGYGGDRGWVFLAAFLGCWAVGRWRGRCAEPLVVAGLLLGLGLNALLAVRQAVSDGPGLLGLVDGRAAGFPGSPVYLGALMGGGLALTAALLARSPGRWWAWTPAVLACSVAANLSASRVAMIGSLVVGVAVVARAGWARLGAYLAAVAIGVVLAAALLPDTAGAARVTSGDGGGGVTARTLMWQAGLEATAERPLVGWGPGRFREATSGAVDLEFVRAEGIDRFYFDAHNLVVEQLVAVGLPGALLLGAFGVLAARRARGPLAWFAAGVAITWLLQPTALTTVPPALLALGIAGGGPRPEPPSARPAVRAAVLAIAALAGLAAFAFAARDVAVARLVEQANGGGDPVPSLERAAELRPNDPWVADLLTQGLLLRALESPSPETRAAVLASAERATELEPTYHLFWYRLGVVQMSFGPEGRPGWELAQASHEEALRQTPWFTPALAARYDLALWQQQADEARGLFVALCTIDRCPRASLPWQPGRRSGR